MILLHFVIALVQISLCSSSMTAYWRDYNNGTVPSDALVAGKKNEENIYIGQAYVLYGGLIPGHIIPGKNEMFVQNNSLTTSPVHVKQFIKILCSVEKNVIWLPTANYSMETDLNGKVKVLGGHDDNFGNYYVARSAFHNDTYIGRVASTGTDKGIFLGVDDTHKSIRDHENYEILIIDV